MEYGSFHVFLADFGVAKVLTQSTISTTKTNSSASSIGTPGFQPLEQLKAGEITENVDVYALGCVLIELFGEKKVWEGLTAIQILVKVVMEGEVPKYSHLPPYTHSICSMCLQVKDRRATAREVLHAILKMSETD